MESANIEIKSGSPRGFGFVFAAVFAVIGLWPALHGNDARLWSLALSAVFLIIALVRPALLEKPNTWWFKFGLFLGSIVAPIVMGLVYIITIIPMNLFVRLARKDLLSMTIDRSAPTYWVSREGHKQNMKNQF